MRADERRKCLRFLQQRPVIVITRSVGASLYYRSLLTRDFSPDGAFLLVEQKPPVGTAMHMRMPIVLRGVDLRVDFEIEATVVRSEPRGVAIRFEQVCVVWETRAEGPAAWN